jgi:hypothetical protein
MAEVPSAMLQRDRSIDPFFDDDEELYRRFSPHSLLGNEISIDAVQLPDMSVIRQKYGHPK